MKIKEYSAIFIILQSISTCHSILRIENGKDLPNNFNDDDFESRIRRPIGGGSGAAGSGCNFNGIRGKPKTDPTGRFFFDLNYVDVNYNHIFNVNCGGGDSHPGGGGINKPILGGNRPILGGHKPILGGHKPIHGGNKPILGGNKPILGGNNEGGDHQEGIFANKPFLSLLFGDRPLQGLLGQTQSQSQSQSDPYYSINKLPPGQYLLASHPVVGTFTQDLSEFDSINPFKNPKKKFEDVVDFFTDLFAFRR